MLLNLKLFHSIFIIFGCTEFATSSVQIVWKLLFQSRTCISPLWTLSLCNKEKKKCQTVIFKRMIHTNFRASRASEHLSSQTTGPKKKKKDQNCVISVGSGSSDSLYTTKLQPAVFINILLHANTETVEKYPEIFLVAFWLAFTFSGRSYHGLLFSCRRGGFQQSQSHKVTLLSYLCCKFFLGLRRKFSSSSIQDGKPS